MPTQLRLIVVGMLLAGCQQPGDGSKGVEATQMAIHTHKSESILWLGPYRANAARKSSYGNWCGDAISGAPKGQDPKPPRPAVDCWDEACRVHDYVFGRVEDGWTSCHSVFTARGGRNNIYVASSLYTPETTCTKQADDELLDAWASCTATSSQLRFDAVACDAKAKALEECPYYAREPFPGLGVRTCDPALCVPPPPAVAPRQPAPGCAVLTEGPSEKQKFQACCAFVEGAKPAGCCPDDKPYYNPTTDSCEKCQFPTPVLDKSTHVPACGPCPGDKPRWNPAVETCEACPPERPVYDRPTNSCVPRYSVTVTIAGSGTGTVAAFPPEVVCSPSGCTGQVAGSPNGQPGPTLILTATASTGSAFVGWRGDCTGSAVSVAVQIEKDIACEAVFDRAPAQCESPEDVDCDGTPGQWAGCRGLGCWVCEELVRDYPYYFDHNPCCKRNTTCAGRYFTCNAKCPAPTDADRVP